MNTKGSSSTHSVFKDIETDDGSQEQVAIERRIIRRVDWRLLPFLGALYALAIIDRSNLGIARTVGMGVQLGLSKGSRYSVVTWIYYIPYILLELPANLAMRRLGARFWLPLTAVAWGLVQLGMGFVTTWGDLALCRVLLGVFEAGLFPSLVYIIQTWYKRDEVQVRLAGFYVISILIGGFSAIFAYGVSLLDGKQGIAGWSWIFIIEGALTVAVGILAWFFATDFPHKNTFLTEEETKIILQRVEQDRGDSVPDTMTLAKIFHHFSDWTIWIYGLMYICCAMPALAIGFFVTIILGGMGYNIRDALLLSTPPFVFAAISIMAFAWLSDKYTQRALWMAVQSVFTIIGLFLTGYCHQPGVRYFGIFLANAGSCGCIPGILAYSANNTVSHSKRAVSTAVIIACGGVAGIFAATVFRQQDYPRYIPGIQATIACQFLFLALLALTTFYFRRQNRLVREGKLAYFIEGRPGFFYTL